MSPTAASDPVFELDFGGAPPAQGSLADRIPPGTYALRLEKMERVIAKSGALMARVGLRVNEGELAGKRLSEQFVFPASPDGSQFGLQRFHAFLIALGMKEQQKAVRIDGSVFVGKVCVAEVDDEEMPATDNYPARIRSRPLAFYRVGDPNIPNGASPQAAAPEPDDEPETPALEAPAPAPAPKAKAAKATAAAAPAPAAEEEPAAGEEAVDPDSVTAQLEDLFGDD